VQQSFVYYVMTRPTVGVQGIKQCCDLTVRPSVCLSLGQQGVQLSQRYRAAGCVGFSLKWKTGTGRQYFTDIIGLSSTTVT